MCVHESLLAAAAMKVFTWKTDHNWEAHLVVSRTQGDYCGILQLLLIPRPAL